MSNTGIADNSVGGNVTNPAEHSSHPSRDAQDRANPEYGSRGPSAGYDNDVEKDFGERKQEGGVKGLMNKITDTMHPSHDQPVQQVSPLTYISEDWC